MMPFTASKVSVAALGVFLTVWAATPTHVPAVPQSCQQLVAKYDGSNWWWGAFGNCKRAGGPTTPDAIFQCAWNPSELLTCGLQHQAE